MRLFYLLFGVVSVGLGIIGAILPIVPTVPFLILAAWCFGKSNPVWEQRLLTHPQFGPHIRAWRERGAIARIGKLGATFAFAASVILGLVLLSDWMMFVPLGIAVIALTFIWTRPDR